MLRSALRPALPIALLAWLLLPPAPARAQAGDLDRAEALIAEGDYVEARELLDEWLDRSTRTAITISPDDRARARLLRARLAPDLDRAEHHYLAVLLGYPATREAAEALLRLGQGLFLDGQVDRARGYLQRLYTDHPGTPLRAAGLLWLARAYRAGGSGADACRMASMGLDGPADEAVRELLAAEAVAACADTTEAVAVDAGEDAGNVAADAAGGENAEVDTAGAADETAERDAGADADAAPLRPFAVQAGAFRDPAGAARLADRLRDAGYEPRLVRVPRNRLLRVRIGRFGSVDAAAAAARRLVADGFEAVVVRDATDEQPR